MKKLLFLLFLIPNLVTAKGLVFDCTVQYDKDFHIISGQPKEDLKFFDTDPYNDTYQYDSDKEVLINSKSGLVYFCEKNNWVLKCTKYMEDNTFLSKQTIEIGRKDLNFLLVRDSKHRETREETRNFKYNGKCKVIEENQF